MKTGDTFRFRSGDPHLWIVISDPAKDADKVLIVNVTSWRGDKDQTCLVGPGDHPLIEHNSCINFRGSRVYPELGEAELRFGFAFVRRPGSLARLPSKAIGTSSERALNPTSECFRG